MRAGTRSHRSCDNASNHSGLDPADRDTPKASCPVNTTAVHDVDAVSAGNELGQVVGLATRIHPFFADRLLDTTRTNIQPNRKTSTGCMTNDAQ